MRADVVPTGSASVSVTATSLPRARGEATEIALCSEGDVLEILGRGPVVVSRVPS
jgi:hypothetical protein